jgi:hypothetical protein
VLILRGSAVDCRLTRPCDLTMLSGAKARTAGAGAGQFSGLSMTRLGLHTSQLNLPSTL